MSVHALVTGGGSGIGAAIAARLAAGGARITVLGRGRERIERAAASLERGFAVSADVTEVDAVGRAFDDAVARFGPIDVLVNSAGAAESMPLARTTDALWRRMIDVNLSGAFHCTRAFLGQRPAPDPGRIVNVASTAGLRGYAYVGAYCAAKHGLIGLTRSLALETAATGITVNAVCPGFTETELLEASLDNIVATTGRDREEAAQLLRDVNPQGRFVTPAEVASAVAWLVEPAQSSITGQAIAVAGGEVM